MNEIDEYILQQPEEHRERLREIRAILRSAAPEATEKISWRMPTFYLNGNLVHFACHKNHIGFYPGDSGVREFEKALSGLSHSKGAIQFPWKDPLPEQLIRGIVAFRIKEQASKSIRK